MDFPKIPKECKSLMCKYFTKDIFEELKDKKTKNGFTLLQAINSGLKNPDSSIGVYAGDEESYSLFDKLFDPVIEEYHGFKKEDTHKSDFELEKFNGKNPDKNGDFILSTRVRVGRNLADFPLGPAIGKEQRDEVEKIVSTALNELDGELKGNYYPLLGMSKEIQENLIKEHFLFKEGDRFLEAAGLNRDWPSGRGIFHNDNKTFLVWINEEDQLRIISMQKGGDIKEVFSRLANAVKKLEESMKFSFNSHLGYITSCPTNLGTAMRASVHIKLPNLSKDMDRFNEITDKYHLQIRGIHGEHSKSEGGVYDISNRRRLGVSEIECIEDLYSGVVALIKAEKSYM